MFHWTQHILYESTDFSRHTFLSMASPPFLYHAGLRILLEKHFPFLFDRNPVMVSNGLIETQKSEMGLKNQGGSHTNYM